MFSYIVNISILVCVISAVHCRRTRSVSDDGNLVLLENGTVVDLDATNPVIGSRAIAAKEVVLYLFTKVTGQNNPCVITSDSCTNWKNCGFDPAKKSFIITHGWTHNWTSESCQEIKNAFFKARIDSNIFIADWGALSQNYLTAVSKLKEIGQFLANIINFSHSNCGLDPKKLKCIGHSLGAHVCGHLCAAVTGKCGEICGLDPAAPFITAGLSEADADCVDIIHSSSQGLAKTKVLGHRDWYPCGARDQYSCEPTLPAQQQSGGCDHRMAPLLYADSIINPKIFKAECECDSTEKAMAKQCSKYDVEAYMGHHDTTTCQRGIYYLNTHTCYLQLQG